MHHKGTVYFEALEQATGVTSMLLFYDISSYERIGCTHARPLQGAIHSCPAIAQQSMLL